MNSRPPDQERSPDASFEKEATADDAEYESECLHAQESPSEDTSIAGTTAVTPERFYARLRLELSKRGISYDDLPKITKEGEAPACYTAVNVPFDTWLSSASLLGATVPYRYDMPAEPNYCWDCTPDFRRQAKLMGACRFPNTRFEKMQTVIRDGGKKIFETEIVGISRSREAAITDAQLQNLLPEDA